LPSKAPAQFLGEQTRLLWSSSFVGHSRASDSSFLGHPILGANRVPPLPASFSHPRRSGSAAPLVDVAGRGVSFSSTDRPPSNCGPHDRPAPREERKRPRGETRPRVPWASEMLPIVVRKFNAPQAHPGSCAIKYLGLNPLSSELLPLSPPNFFRGREGPVVSGRIGGRMAGRQCGSCSQRLSNCGGGNVPRARSGCCKRYWSPPRNGKPG